MCEVAAGQDLQLLGPLGSQNVEAALLQHQIYVFTILSLIFFFWYIYIK
jgi:hypothetical protein